MKSKQILKIFLYICSLLSLAYMAFQLFYTYNSVIAYYDSYGMSPSATDLLQSMVGACFSPFMTAIILFGIANVVEMLIDIRQEFEVASDLPETTTEEVQTEKLTEEVSSEVKVESNTEETESKQEIQESSNE